MPTGSHPAIRRVKRQGVYPAIHGNKLWNSSFLLIDYLNKNRPEHCASVMDAGCGWGIGGIWCAKVLGSQVTSVDADPDVFPFLDAVAGINQVQTSHLVSRFEKISTAITARHMTSAARSDVVTARAEQIPRICRVIGLLSTSGSRTT